MHRLWLIAYDIVEDRTRLQVERLLHGLGERVQWSVFEAFLSPEQMRRLQFELSALIDPAADNVRCYPLCAWCQERVDWAGEGRRSEDPVVIVV